MTITVTPSQSATLTALRSFLLAVLPPGTEVDLAQVNRVPEPKIVNFVLMTPTRRVRIETNIDSQADAVFAASIVGTAMTVASIEIGTILVGNQVFGTGLSTGSATLITGTIGSSGGTGIYLVSPPQSVPSQTLSSGGAAVLQPTDLTVQLDVHGPLSADNAQVITTLFRDPYATAFFATLSANIVPLYADDPRQVPFINAESQYEDRWIVEAHLQVNQTVAGFPQQFADTLDVTLINVEEAFPP